MRRIFCGIILACFAVITISVSPASALTGRDLSGKTWLFFMDVAADGTMSDNGTMVFDQRWTKTELKELLKALTVGSPISYANITTIRVKVDPEDWTMIMYFDSAGYSLYGYVMPTKISPEEE